MLMTKMVGISKSLICVNKSKLRFRFSTSVTTIATSGYSLSFFVQHQLNDNIFINGTGIQTVPGKSNIFPLTLLGNLQKPIFFQQ
jgi:hypothetical protein